MPASRPTVVFASGQLLTAEVWGPQAAALERLEAGLHAGLAARDVGRDGRRETLQRPGTEIGQGEEAADEPACVLGDDHLTGAGDGLQA